MCTQQRKLPKLGNHHMKGALRRIHHNPKGLVEGEVGSKWRKFRNGTSCCLPTPTAANFRHCAVHLAGTSSAPRRQPCRCSGQIPGKYKPDTSRNAHPPTVWRRGRRHCAARSGGLRDRCWFGVPPAGNNGPTRFPPCVAACRRLPWPGFPAPPEASGQGRAADSWLLT